MKVYNYDWKDYIDSMELKDITIIDPPWNYNQKSIQNTQLKYDLLFDNSEFLDYVFKNIKSKHILIWTTNSMLIDVFRCNHYNFIYKSCMTWVKTTTKNNLMFGMGFSFRNCTEQLLLFSLKSEVPIRSKLRNVIIAQAGKRTIKPKKEEVKLLNEFIKIGFNKFAYIFSGPQILEFNEYDIDCVDKGLKENLFFKNIFEY